MLNPRAPGRKRLDLIASTRHDVNAAADYRMLADHGIRTVRDGLRWHLIETTPGHYDWSSFLPMLRAARETGTQVIWDVAHYGWPDDIDIWSPAFVDRFAAFARRAGPGRARGDRHCPVLCARERDLVLVLGGWRRGLYEPACSDRGRELKAVLVRAAIAAIEAIGRVEPRARFIHTEPAITIHPKSDRWEDRVAGATTQIASLRSGTTLRTAAAGAGRKTRAPRHRWGELLRPQSVDRRGRLDGGRSPAVPAVSPSCATSTPGMVDRCSLPRPALRRTNARFGCATWR